MNVATTSAHLEPTTPTRVNVFADATHSSPFVSLRIGNGPVEIALIAVPGTSDALRALAAAADEAARALDQMTEHAPETSSAVSA